MTDPFARKALRRANERINELAAMVERLEAQVKQRPLIHVAFCSLCGAPCKGTRRYCHAHSWAEGTD